MDHRKTRFKATTLSGGKYHDKKLMENLQRQKTQRSSALLSKRGITPLDIVSAGSIRRFCASTAFDRAVCRQLTRRAGLVLSRFDESKSSWLNLQWRGKSNLLGISC